METITARFNRVQFTMLSKLNFKTSLLRKLKTFEFSFLCCDVNVGFTPRIMLTNPLGKLDSSVFRMSTTALPTWSPISVQEAIVQSNGISKNPHDPTDGKIPAASIT